MGTSSKYTGAGGKAGKEISEGVREWCELLQVSPSSDDIAKSKKTAKPFAGIPPQVVRGFLRLLQLGSTSDGSGKSIATGDSVASGGSGRIRAGWGRSAQRLAAVSSRAAIGAFAYARGDAATLSLLGLDYDELRALGDPLEVTRRIVVATCGQQSSGTLEETEERYVAASVADWVLKQSEGGEPLDVDEIARHALATIFIEVLLSEFCAILRDQPGETVDVLEDEMRAAAKVLARQAELSDSGPTTDELTKAIEGGIGKLREIYGGES